MHSPSVAALLSPLHASVLAGLGNRIVTGRVLRDKLEAAGFSCRGSNFYQLVARVEAAGLITSGAFSQTRSGRVATVYRATPEGQAALVRTIEFFEGLK